MRATAAASTTFSCIDCIRYRVYLVVRQHVFVELKLACLLTTNYLLSPDFICIPLETYISSQRSKLCGLYLHQYMDHCHLLE